MGMMTYTIILTSLNLILLGILLTTYLQSYKKLKAAFVQGLILFAGLFVIQKIVSLYIYLILMEQLEGSLANSMFVLELLQFFAFTVFTWITVKS